MSEITLQQVKCPSCGSVISSFSAFKPEVECPFCHTKSINPMVTPKSVARPERIIPFNTDEKQFEKTLVDVLIKRDYIPTDIFERISSEDVIKAYVPMFLYEGSFDASWGCEIGHKETRYRTNSKGERESYSETVYNYEHGGTRGNFAFLCLAYKGDDVPGELLNFCSRFSYRPGDSSGYDPEIMSSNGGDEAITLPTNVDKKTVWDSVGRKKVRQEAEEACKHQLSSADYRNLRVEHSFTVDTDGALVLVPFWFVYYAYGEQRYYFAMDGQGKHTDCTVPQNEDEKKLVHAMWGNFRKAFWLLLVVAALYFVAEWTGVLIGGVLWAVLQLFLYNKANKEEKAQLAASKERRLYGARRLGLVNVPSPGPKEESAAPGPATPQTTPKRLSI